MLPEQGRQMTIRGAPCKPSSASPELSLIAANSGRLQSTQVTQPTTAAVVQLHVEGKCVVRPRQAPRPLTPAHVSSMWCMYPIHSLLSSWQAPCGRQLNVTATIARKLWCRGSSLGSAWLAARTGCSSSKWAAKAPAYRSLLRTGQEVAQGSVLQLVRVWHAAWPKAAGLWD